MKILCLSIVAVVSIFTAAYAQGAQGGLLGGLTGGLTDGVKNLGNTAVNTAKGVLSLPTLVITAARNLAEIVADSDVLGDPEVAVHLRVIVHSHNGTDTKRIEEIKALVEPEMQKKFGDDPKKLAEEMAKVETRMHRLIAIHDWIYDRITKPDVSPVTATAVRLMGNLVLPDKDGKMTVLPLNTQALDILSALKGLDIAQFHELQEEYAKKNAEIKGIEL